MKIELAVELVREAEPQDGWRQYRPNVGTCLGTKGEGKAINTLGVGMERSDFLVRQRCLVSNTEDGLEYLQRLERNAVVGCWLSPRTLAPF
jgi:hypothetical protein